MCNLCTTADGALSRRGWDWTSGGGRVIPLAVPPLRMADTEDAMHALDDRVHTRSVPSKEEVSML